ncbi:dihydroxyacetone kinase subunit DhaL [Caproiciproducens galactitolivorans]|uniref:dihydroxyacetone kinase subunit DhaL n=1 Tax=Caproiciproducens galactitolivorans TaxID=642589 RepID=UPI002409EDA8|nr:dihydroxyacetone kinase subunit DhaL [Caproiciproducens galactitolivorans]
MNTLDTRQLKDMFLFVARRVVESEDFLTEIDLKLGDGDHGFGMALGFKAVQEALKDKEFETVENLFQEVGMTLLDTMGGASGVLFGTMFISGIVGLEPHKEADLALLAGIYRRSLEALKRRGKAQVGDKTMVDAFEPAVVGLEEAAAENADLPAGLAMGAECAKKGMEHTRDCVAKFGRAKSYGTKALGLQDAGATSVWIIFQAMSDWASERKGSE